MYEDQGRCVTWQCARLLAQWDEPGEDREPELVVTTVPSHVVRTLETWAGAEAGGPQFQATLATWVRPCPKIMRRAGVCVAQWWGVNLRDSTLDTCNPGPSPHPVSFFRSREAKEDVECHCPSASLFGDLLGAGRSYFCL